MFHPDFVWTESVGQCENHFLNSGSGRGHCCAIRSSEVGVVVLVSLLSSWLEKKKKFCSHNFHIHFLSNQKPQIFLNLVTKEPTG